MYKIEYLPIARRDITNILTYISNQLNAPKAAMELLDEFDTKIAVLREFPYSHGIYRTIKPLKKEYRMLAVKRYAIFYIVKEQKQVVEIQRVMYAKSDMLTTLTGDL